MPEMPFSHDHFWKIAQAKNFNAIFVSYKWENTYVVVE